MFLLFSFSVACFSRGTLQKKKKSKRDPGTGNPLFGQTIFRGAAAEKMGKKLAAEQLRPYLQAGQLRGGGGPLLRRVGAGNAFCLFPPSYLRGKLGNGRFPPQTLGWDLGSEVPRFSTNVWPMAYGWPVVSLETSICFCSPPGTKNEMVLPVVIDSLRNQEGKKKNSVLDLKILCPWKPMAYGWPVKEPHQTPGSGQLAHHWRAAIDAIGRAHQGESELRLHSLGQR